MSKQGGKAMTKYLVVHYDGKSTLLFSKLSESVISLCKLGEIDVFKIEDSTIARAVFMYDEDEGDYCILSWAEL